MTTTGPGPRLTGRWRLEDAEAHFGEVVRRVRTEGPQIVTANGRDEVVVLTAEDFRHLSGGTTADLTGAALVAAFQESPHKDLEIEPSRHRLPVRGADL